MARFLSPEWLAAQQARAATIEIGDAGPSEPIVVEHEVTVADGEVTYHVIVDRAGVSVHGGRAAAATVTFSSDEPTAQAISEGRLSAQAAYMAGRLRLRGDVSALLRWGPTLAQLPNGGAHR